MNHRSPPNLERLFASFTARTSTYFIVNTMGCGASSTLPNSSQVPFTHISFEKYFVCGIVALWSLSKKFFSHLQCQVPADRVFSGVPGDDGTAVSSINDQIPGCLTDDSNDGIHPSQRLVSCVTILTTIFSSFQAMPPFGSGPGVE